MYRRAAALPKCSSSPRESLHPCRVGDLDLPAVKLELVVHEGGAGHRLDRRPQRLPMPANAHGQAAKTVCVGRCRAHFDRLAGLVEQVKIEALATEIQTSVQHGNGPPCGRSRWTTRRLPPGRPSFIAFLTMRSARQLVATHGNGFGLFEPFSGLSIATSCHRLRPLAP